MKKRILVFSLIGLLAILPALQPTYAILGIFDVVYDPAVEATIAAQSAMQATNWIQQLLNQIEQIKYAIDTYLQLKDVYTNLQDTLKLHQLMSQFLHDLRSYSMAFGRWQGSGSGADLFGTTAGIRQAMGGLYSPGQLGQSYSQSILRLGSYDPSSLSTMNTLEKDRLTASASSVGISDSASQQALATVASVGGAIQSAASRVDALMGASMSDVPEMNTYAALLNRINVASAMQVASQQDSNKLLSVIANSQAVALKVQRDGYADAINRDIYIKKNLSKDWDWAFDGAGAALAEFRTSDYARF